MIFIKNVSLQNFRNYKNADVNIVEKEGVFFLYGNNGGGKTTLLNAINWCLYGDIVFHGTDENNSPRPNWANDADVTKVRIIVHDDDKKYQFVRTTTGYNNVGDLEAREIDENGNAGANCLPPYEVDAIIKRILPENIKSLFFLSETFSKEILGHKSANSLKSNIYKVSELDTINLAIRHLDLTESYYAKTISKAVKDSDKIKDLSERIEHDKKMVTENEESVTLATSKISEHEEALAKLNTVLENSKQARELLEQEAFYREQKEEAESDIANDEADITDCVQKTYPKVLLLEGIEEYMKALNEAKDAGKIPAPINPKIIAQSKRDKKCACCGRDITELELKFMDEQQARYEEIDKLKFLADGIHQFSDIQTQINDSWCILRDAMDKLEKNNKKKAGFEDQLESVSEKLSDIKGLANLPNNPQERRREIQEKIEKWQSRRREYARNIVELKEDIEKAHKERKRIMGSAGGDAMILEKELDRIKGLRDLLTTLRDNAEKFIREQIKNGVWESYKRILPDTQFVSIELDDDYTFSFIDKSGYPSMVNSLSVGESKSLALSLISTLSNDIGYSDTPLFIDNLFAGISSTHFAEITRCVESISDKKQIFITYLSERDGAKVSNNFNPAVIRQNIHSIKKEDGICYIEEDK